MHISNLKTFYFINDFDRDHISKLNKNINIIYRNYDKKLNVDYLKNIRNFCKINRFKIFLANDLKNAIKLKFDGVYIPSFNKKIFRKDNLKKNFLILGSAHNLSEIRIKEKQGVTSLFLSPIFSKKNKQPLGLYRFMNLKRLTNINVVALGGINKNSIKKLNLINVNQFASISYINKLYAK